VKIVVDDLSGQEHGKILVALLQQGFVHPKRRRA